MLDEDRLIELEMALDKIQWDIFGISEVRRCEEKLIELKNGNVLYHSHSKRGIGGVGFIIKSTIKQHVINYITISDRVIAIDLEIEKSKFRLIQAYAPTTKSSEEESDKFYEDLSCALRGDNNNIKNIYILGDFNSQIGQRNVFEDHIMGPYCYGKRNERGEKLILFCQEHQLKIGNSMFKSRRGKMWTWISPDGKTKNQIDFIMTNQPNSFYNVKVLSHFMIDSDHRPVIAKLSIEKPRRQWTPQNFTKQYVHTDVHSILIRKLLDNKHDTTQEMYNKLEKVLIDIEKDSTTQVKEKINVISSETKSIIAERNKIKWKSNKTNTEKQQLRSLQKEARHRIRKDLRLHYLKMVEEIMGTTGSIKEIEKRKKIGKDMISTLQQSSGKFTSSRHEILETATAFYKALYDSDDILETCITNKALKDIPPLLKSEIRYVIENLKNNKATGKDKISNEVIKYYCEDLLEPLQLIYNKILHTGTLPKQWYLASIILLHKKKCQKDINNYRPISLSSTLYKIFMTVLKNRLYRALDENQTVEQAGFRKGFSTMDHLHTLNMIIEKYSEYNKSLYICFIDFTKAFDSINQNYLLRALQNQGIDAGYVKILEKVYSKSMASINLETEGPTFPLRKGVKQGDPISPLLFNSLLEEVF